MNNAEFVMQMQRLHNTFGDRAYPTEREKLIWAEVRYLPVEVLTRIVSELISNHRTPPMLPDFKAAKAALVGSSSQGGPSGTPLEDRAPCGLCERTGSITATKNVEGYEYEYAFRCTCPSGSRYSGLPQWSERYESEYVPFVVGRRSANPAVNHSASALLAQAFKQMPEVAK